MMVWKRFYGLSDYWDEALTYSEDYNVFQSYMWGEFKKTTGWVPERWIASDKNGDIICMVQILIKSFPAGFKIGWATGGPVFISKNSSTKDFDNMLSGLAETVCRNNSAIVTRFNSQLCYDQLASYTFNKYFKRPFFRLNSGYSLLFDLTLSVKELKQRISHVKNKPRRFGRSKHGISRFMKGILDLMTLIFLSHYTDRPLHLFGSGRILLFVTGFCLGFYFSIQGVLLLG
jgi:hypothetical protein